MHVPSFAASQFAADGACRAIIDELGEEVFKTLQRQFGGQDIAFPHAHRMGDDHPIVQAVGRQNAERLGRLFAGERVYMPCGVRSFPNLGRVIEELRAGTPDPLIASRIGVSPRHLRRLKQRVRDLAESDPMLFAAE